MQLEKIKIESLANETVILDDAGAHKNLKTKVEDLFGFRRHHNIQGFYLAHYAKDVLPEVRENCLKIYITKNNPDNFFETLIKTYSNKNSQDRSSFLNKLQNYRIQMDYGILDFDTRSQKYKILNHKSKVLYDSSKRNKWSPEDYVASTSYFLQVRNTTK